MQSLRWFSILGLCLSLVLTACAQATPAPALIPPTPAATRAPTTPIPTIIPRPTPLEPVDSAVPVITYSGGQSTLLVVSSVTGKPFDEFPSIPLAYYDNYAFSPDGKTLAVISNTELHLIDLPSWKDHTTDVDLHGPINSVVYSRDGNMLVLAGGISGGDLRVIDARNGEMPARAQAGFSIRNLRFSADGKSIMAYGPQLAETGSASSVG